MNENAIEESSNDQTVNEDAIEESSNDQLPDKIAKLKAVFVQLQFASSQPRLYMAEYFSTLINRVDSSAEKYLMKEEDTTSEISRKVRSDQSKMIETINEHQSDLFRSELEEDFGLSDKIRDIELRLEAPISSDDVSVIGLNIEETMHELQRRIFMNKGLWFRVWEDAEDDDKNEDHEETVDDDKNEDDKDKGDEIEMSRKLFGTLFVLEEEFVSDISNQDNFDYR